MSQRLPCSRCGEFILPETATRNGGLCMPCKGNYRERIEAGKLRRERDRAYEQSAERKYWLDLVRRVHKTPQGFGGLSQTEKTYFAVSCLVGEVYNGGFDQFFSNSSGELYGLALDGLLELEAKESAVLLEKAKEVLFGDAPVPIDQAKRNEIMPTVANEFAPEWEQLNMLDKAFCRDPDKLAERCKVYAIKHQLYTE